jgi:hypothetical protein
MSNGDNFVGYEYKNLTVTRNMENVYLDSYPSFGWKLEGSAPLYLPNGLSSVMLKFKRDRKIKNKNELVKLEQQFESIVYEIEKLEKSKQIAASITAFTIGIIGTAFMAGSVFAYLQGITAFMVVLALPAFFGWLLPYFCYMNIKAKRTQAIVPIIDKQYDVMYEVCEKANALLPV